MQDIDLVHRTFPLAGQDGTGLQAIVRHWRVFRVALERLVEGTQPGTSFGLQAAIRPNLKLIGQPAAQEVGALMLGYRPEAIAPDLSQLTEIEIAQTGDLDLQP